MSMNIYHPELEIELNLDGLEGRIEQERERYAEALNRLGDIVHNGEGRDDPRYRRAVNLADATMHRLDGFQMAMAILKGEAR